MICSIPTGKSGSNWLDRLRSAKGFPAGDDLDLDHFLNQNNPDPSNSPKTDASDPKSDSGSTHSDEKPVLNRNQTTEISTRNGEKEWYGVMSNVLSELFIMGDSNEISRYSGKKIPRKQTNPKICVISTSTSGGGGDERCYWLDDVRRGDEGAFNTMTVTVPSSGDNSLAEIMDANGGDRVDVEEEEEEEEGQKCNNGDLLGYSKSEVTIIDTSYASWKCEKYVFRRKNVWKVRDKKGKPRSVCEKKKKRKEILCGKNGCGNKKLRVSILPSKDGNGEEGLLVPSNEGQNPQNDKRLEARIETPDIFSQVPMKRFPFPRMARKSRKGGSSVIHIKGTPTSKNNGSSNPLMNSVKDTQRQSKA